MSEFLLLTDSERIRFATWLEQEATTDDKLVEQMRNLGPALVPMMAHRSAEAEAARLIAKKLRSTHGGSIE